jgi:Zn-dependent M28 family amino/carboxypeptidase
MPKIPAAAVTIEAAELMQRLTQQGETVKVTLQMEAQTLPDANSANVIAEIPGREKPEEIVLISGHIDSWDVGTGASDDGAGCVIAMEAARLIKKLNLKPRRTIRVVLFTNEENGLRGAVGYGEQHRAEFSKHIAAIEADSGGAKPLGFSFEGKEKGFNYLQDFLPLLRGVEADQLTKGGGGADISILTNTGVPSLGLRPDSSHYFDVHHTEADTLEKIEPINMATNSATLAIMTYLLADMPDPIPRD